MCLICEKDSVNNELFKIKVPFFRTDIMHPCDIGEDLAIAYGYNNIPNIEPHITTTGQ